MLSNAKVTIKIHKQKKNEIKKEQKTFHYNAKQRMLMRIGSIKANKSPHLATKGTATRYGPT